MTGPDPKPAPVLERPVLLKITEHPTKPGAFKLPCRCSGKPLQALIDTGATCSVVSAQAVPPGVETEEVSTAIKVASGEVVACTGRVPITVELGTHRIIQKCFVMDTKAFSLVLGMDFVRKHVQGILLHPDRLIVGGEEFLMSPHPEYQQSNFRMFRTESYQLIPALKTQAIVSLNVSPQELGPSELVPPITTNPDLHGEKVIISSCNVDLFASLKNRNERMFCCTSNSAWVYDWRSLGLTWANPPFSKMMQTLTKIALEEADMILLAPLWEHKKSAEKWSELLKRLTVRQVLLPDDVPLYIPEAGTKPLPKPKWSSAIYFVSGRLNKVPREQLDKKLVKRIQSKCLGWGTEELEGWMDRNVPSINVELSAPVDPPPVPPRESTPLAWDQLSLPCSTIPDDEQPELISEWRNDSSILSFYVDTLLEEVDNPFTPEVENDILCYLRGSEGESKAARANFKPTGSKAISREDLQSLRDQIEHRINFLEHEQLLAKLRTVWGPKIDGFYPEEDDDYAFVCYNFESQTLETLTYDDLDNYEELFQTADPSANPNAMKKNEYGESNLQSGTSFQQILESCDPSLHSLLSEFESSVFGPLPPPHTVPKLVKMDLELKEEFANATARSRPYPANLADAEEIERQVQEGIESNILEEYKGEGYPKHCSPCYLVDKPGSKARRLVVVYCKVNKMTKNHPGTLPLMENTCERMAKCRYKSKVDLRSGFWQVELTERAKDLLAFVTPKGRVYKWNVMPFGVSSAPAIFQELMNKVLQKVRLRPRVKALLKRGAELEVHIDDVCLGTNSQEDHLILLEEFFLVCEEAFLRVRLEKCEFLREQLDFLGYEMGYGWWRPNPSKLQPLLSAQIQQSTPTKSLKALQSFLGAANFYRRHVTNFTYSSAPLTDLIKKSSEWRWGEREQQSFEELKSKLAACTLLGVPKAQGEIVLITDASDVGGGGSLFQWQKLSNEELSSVELELRTLGVTSQGLLKHDYPDGWVLVPLGHWNWKWNHARSHYSTYEQELLAGVLTLASQSRLVGINPVLWLCDQDSVQSFLKPQNPPPECKKRRRWFSFLSQFRLVIKHIPGIKNELCDYTSRNNFDQRIGADSEALAKEAFTRMDVHLDLGMEQLQFLETYRWWDYAEEYSHLSKLKEGEYQYVEQAMFARAGSLLTREGMIVVPKHKLEATLGWLHKASGHPGPEKLLYHFLKKFYSPLSSADLSRTIYSLPYCIPCALSKQNTSSDRSLAGALHIPQLINTQLFVDFTEVDRYDGYNYLMVVTCGLSRFTRAYACTKNITSEEALHILFRDWIEVYGLPTRIHSDNDKLFAKSKSGWWQGVLHSLGVKTTFGIPYRPQSNALAEKQNKALKCVLRILMTRHKSSNWLRLLPIAVWMMNNQYMPSIGTTPGELFLGRPYWRLFENPHPTEANPTVRSWIQEQVRLAEIARATLAKFRDKAIARRWKNRPKSATYIPGDLVLVHKDRFPRWKRKHLDPVWWGPYRVLSVKPGSVYVQASPKLGGKVRVGTAQHIKKYPVSEEPFEDLWEELAADTAAWEDKEAGAEVTEVQTPKETPVKPQLIVEKILKADYHHCWKFLTKFVDYPVGDATWETVDAFVVAKGVLNPIFEEFCIREGKVAALEQAKRRAKLFVNPSE